MQSKLRRETAAHTPTKRADLVYGDCSMALREGIPSARPPRPPTMRVYQLPPAQ